MTIKIKTYLFFVIFTSCFLITGSAFLYWEKFENLVVVYAKELENEEDEDDKKEDKKESKEGENKEEGSNEEENESEGKEEVKGEEIESEEGENESGNSGEEEEENDQNNENESENKIEDKQVVEGEMENGEKGSDDGDPGKENPEKIEKEIIPEVKMQATVLAEPAAKKDSEEEAEIKPSDVIINEFVSDPISGGKEWVEFYNSTDEKINLDGWRIEDNARSKPLKGEIDSKEFFVLEISGSFLNNGGDRIVLFDNTDKDGDEKDQEIDSVFYGNYKGDDNNHLSIDNAPATDDPNSVALKKDGESDRKDSEDFAVTSIPTPGEKNKFPEKKKYPGKIFFNEVIPNPDGKDKNNEWVELFNANEEEVDLTGWKIENGSGKTFIITDLTISAEGFGVVKIKNSSFSIRNRDEKLKLIDPNGDVVNKIEISGYASAGRSFNKTEEDDWRWSRFLTPGEKNRLNILPVVKIKKSKKIYKNVYAKFDASKTKDADGDKLKFVWDFGDGHKSYKKEIRHRYEKKGKYTASLTVDDGSEKVTETFKIKVKSFPRWDLQLVKLVPNPVGKDSGNEKIVVKNNSSKKVNLLNFKFSTGKDLDSLINHPVYDDFWIKPGEEKELLNDEMCRFSLYNKNGALALLYPDGKTADEVEWEKEKILDDEAYVLVNDEWEWVGGVVTTKKTSVQVQGVNTEKENFDWTKATLNERLKQCDCFKKIKIENWRSENENWLEFFGQLFGFGLV